MTLDRRTFLGTVGGGLALSASGLSRTPKAAVPGTPTEAEGPPRAIAFHGFPILDPRPLPRLA